MPTPSLIAIPADDSSKGRQRPVGESACDWLKHKNPKGLCTVSTPPTITISLERDVSSRTARYTAANEEAQAASTAKFTPPRLKRFATRPAATFNRIPAKESSVQRGSRS